MREVGIYDELPKDTAIVAKLRKAAQELATGSRIALLIAAAELVLEVVPEGQERQEARQVLELAARTAADPGLNPDPICEAMLENDQGIVRYQMAAEEGEQSKAWEFVVGVLGYTAYQCSERRGEATHPLIENFVSPDAVDITIDPLIEVPDVDADALGRVIDYAREHGSSASEGWGRTLSISELRHVAGRDRPGPSDVSRRTWESGRVTDLPYVK